LWTFFPSNKPEVFEMAENFFPKKEDTKVRQEFSGSKGDSGMKKPGGKGPTMVPGPTQLFGNEKSKKK
jgi:hypothetical protein